MSTQSMFLGRKNLSAKAPICINKFHRKRLAITCRGASDPYSVLGIPPDSDQNAINRAYTKKKAENRGKGAELSKIEEAHSRLMLSALNSRLKGNAKVSKDILYADREPLFPWRPRRWDATPKVIMIVGGIQLALVALGFQQPQFGKVIACMAVGIVGNVIKLNAINPPPKDNEIATEEEAGRAGKNFVRGALLGLMATFAGIILTSWPEFVMPYVRRSFILPASINLPKLLIAMKITAAALFNWIMTSFYY